VEVVNKNTIGFTTHVGEGRAKLHDMVPTFNQKSPVVVPLFNKMKNNLKQGQVGMTVTISRNDDPKSAQGPNVSDTGKVSMTIGSNDSVESPTTPLPCESTLKDIDSMKSRNREMSMEMPPINNTTTGITDSSPNVSRSDEVLDKVVKESSPAGTSSGLNMAVSSDIVAGDDAPICIESIPVEQLDVKSPAVNYKFRLSNMKAVDLLNTGSIMDKQDPLLCINIGSHKFRTKRLKDAGSNGSFPEIFDGIISEAQFRSGVVIGRFNITLQCV